MKIDRILKYTPILSGILVMLGVIYLSVFYHHFNIKIISYLSLADILIAFLSNLNTIVVIFLIATVHYSVSEDIMNHFGEQVTDIIILKFRKFYILLFGITLMLLILSYIYNWLNLAVWNIYLYAFVSIQFLTFLFIRRKRNSDKLETEFILPKLLELLQILVLASVIVLIAQKDINNIEAGGRYKVSVTMKNGKKYETNDKILYLGKTGAYHFFSSKDKSIVIKDDDISKIEIAI